jgi:4-methoxybenzoate monooxygenase (O-demethylating)
MDCPSSDLDPFSDEFLADPQPFHETLREAGPVVWLERYGVFAVARYAEVCSVLDDWRTFCSGRGVGLSDFAKEPPWRTPSLLLEADPPLHTRTRGPLWRAMSGPTLEALRERFAEKAARLVDALSARREIDANRELAEVFVLSVFPDAVGLVEEGRENLLPYGAMAFNAFGPRNRLFEESFANVQKVSGWIEAQCTRGALRPGGLGAHVYAEVDKGELSEDEAGLLVRSMLTAGLDTTVASLNAAIHAFATHPEQWRILREEPSLLRSAFGEVMRYGSPAQTFFRTTSREVEIGGAKLGEGQKVLLFLAAANRDPRKWPEPDRFDIRRRSTGHVAFGRGVHMCVGQVLARMEMELVLAALAKRVAAIEPRGAPTWRLNNTLRSIERLPVALVPA